MIDFDKEGGFEFKRRTPKPAKMWQIWLTIILLTAIAGYGLAAQRWAAVAVAGAGISLLGLSLLVDRKERRESPGCH